MCFYVVEKQLLKGVLYSSIGQHSSSFMDVLAGLLELKTGP